MSTITEFVDVDVDVTTAYNQWTQFESFPRFMEGVEEIRQIDPTHTLWKIKVAVKGCAPRGAELELGELESKRWESKLNID